MSDTQQQKIRILVKSPSNIALVKYMGKSDPMRNLPVNPSLSMTLSSLATFLEIRAVPTSRLGVLFSRKWVAESPIDGKGDSPRITASGTEKFLRHFDRCVSRIPAILADHGVASHEGPSEKLSSEIEIRSSNTFPHAAGIASSASSFSALTLATAVLLSEDRKGFQRAYQADDALRADLAMLSREGSGSSCRSFHGPFVAWDEEQVMKIESNLPPLSDLVVVISEMEKKVSSTEAHARVLTAPTWEGRKDRATARYQQLTTAIEKGKFSTLSEVADADFRDMHQLFETASEPFSYFADGTTRVLDFLDEELSASKIAVTMDAGPNVHVIVSQADEGHWKRKLAAQFPEYPILVDREGQGAEILAIQDEESAGK